MNLTKFSPKMQIALIVNDWSSEITDFINQDSKYGYEKLAEQISKEYTLTEDAWELLLEYYENLEYVLTNN